jgi:hypothetical protein
MDHSEETAGQWVVAGGEGALDLQVTEHAFDAIALLAATRSCWKMLPLQRLKTQFNRPNRFHTKKVLDYNKTTGHILTHA